MPITSISGVICCGNISYDMPVWPVGDFHWGTTTWVQSIEHNVGGNGGNTCTALARLGTPVRLYGCVGSDENGDTILADLRRDGVDVSRVIRSDKPMTSTVCLVHHSGDRLFLHRPGSSSDAHSGMLAFDDGPPFTHFHFANPFALPQIRKDPADLLRRARAAGLTTSLDAGWDALGRWMEDLAPCLPLVDLLFLNESEALKLSSYEDPDRAAATLREAGTRDLVIKLGGRGSIVWWDSERFECPAFPIKPLDTTGAGDCYAGGFLAALYRGRDYREAARLANAVGGMSVEQLGTVRGVGSWEKTLQWMDSRKTA